MSNAKTPQRWYDAYPYLEQSLVAFDSFPPQILEILLEGVIEVAETECRANEILNALKTLGAEKIMALHKSKAKRRSYDKNPQLHKAMNYIFVLSDEQRDYMAQKMMGLIQFVIEYLKACNQFKTTPTMDDIGQITTLYVRRGGDSSREFLNKVRQQFEESLKETTKRLKKDAMPVYLDAQQMRIKRLNQ